jgi:hypothetical protein
VAVMATVAKGYDLDYAWRTVGEAYRDAGYYLAATEAGEPPGTWWGPGAERLGFAPGQQVEREPYDLLFGQRKGPDGQKLGRAPANGGKVVEIYRSLVAAEPGADDHRRAALRIEAQRRARQSPARLLLRRSTGRLRNTGCRGSCLGTAAPDRSGSPPRPEPPGSAVSDTSRTVLADPRTRSL